MLFLLWRVRSHGLDVRILPMLIVHNPKSVIVLEVYSEVVVLFSSLLEVNEHVRKPVQTRSDVRCRDGRIDFIYGFRNLVRLTGSPTPREALLPSVDRCLQNEVCGYGHFAFDRTIKRDIVMQRVSGFDNFLYATHALRVGGNTCD